MRSLSLSTTCHVAAYCALFFSALWGSIFAGGMERRKPGEVLATVQRPAPVATPEELEEVHEVELEELLIEPELVDQQLQPELAPLPTDPEPEALDWLPPDDPLREIDPSSWKPWPRDEPEPAQEPPAQPPPLERARTDAGAAREGTEPLALRSPTPRYPRRAIKLRLEGTVNLRIEVDAAGRVLEVRVLESSGHAILDAAAVAGFEQWLFRPRRAGEPEVRSFKKPFTFQLQ